MSKQRKSQKRQKRDHGHAKAKGTDPALMQAWLDALAPATRDEGIQLAKNMIRLKGTPGEAQAAIAYQRFCQQHHAPLRF